MTGGDLEDRIQRAAAVNSPVIITGETGSGRTYTARRIHALSGRKGPFQDVRFDGGSEGYRPIEYNMGFFSHFNGRYGLLVNRTGPLGYIFDRCEESTHGTICLRAPHRLDERDQRSLIEFGATGRMRAPHYDYVNGFVDDVRLIVVEEALNRKTGCMALVDALRERVDTVLIPVPPLRERTDEIESLMVHFLREAQSNLTPPSEIVELVKQSEWQDNIAGLRAQMQRFARQGDFRLLLAGVAPRRRLRDMGLT